MTINNLRDWCLSNLENIKDRGDSFIAKCPFCGVDEGQFKINHQSGGYQCFRASCANYGRDPAFLISKYENASMSEVRSKYTFLLEFNKGNFRIKNVVEKYNKVQNHKDMVPLPKEFVPCYNNTYREEGSEWIIPKYLADRVRSKKVLYDYEIGFISSKSHKLYNYCVAPCYYIDNNKKVGGYVSRIMSHTVKDYYTEGVENVMFGTKQYLNIKPNMVIITEGIFDVMKLALFGFTGLAVLGIKANGLKINFLKNIAPTISQDCIIMLDPDAHYFAEQLASELYFKYKNVKIATNQKDAGESEYDEILESILNARNA